MNPKLPMLPHPLVPPLSTQPPGHPWSSWSSPTLTSWGVTTGVGSIGANSIIWQASAIASATIALPQLPHQAVAQAPVPLPIQTSQPPALGLTFQWITGGTTPWPSSAYYLDQESGDAILAWLIERREQGLAHLARATTIYETCYLALVERRELILAHDPQVCAWCDIQTCAGMAQAVDPRQPERLLILFSCPWHFAQIETHFAQRYTDDFGLLTYSEIEALRLPVREIRRLRERVQRHLLALINSFTEVLWPRLPAAWWRQRLGRHWTRLVRCPPSWRTPAVSHRAPERSAAKGPAP